MGNPFHFADRFSGAVVHLTTGGPSGRHLLNNNRQQKQKMPATGIWRRHFVTKSS
jgi:hypothetical protein